ncbi:Uncharacterised protein [uncultured archaeon]|nr:Uncharacterised protein [uncultured archaeon]
MAKGRGKKSKVVKPSRSKATRKHAKSRSKKPAKKSKGRKRYMREEAQMQQVMRASEVRTAGYNIEVSKLPAFQRERAAQLVSDWPKMTQPMKAEWKQESYEPNIKAIMNEAKTIASDNARKSGDPTSFKQAMEIATMAQDNDLAKSLMKTQGETLAKKFPEPKTDEPGHAAERVSEHMNVWDRMKELRKGKQESEKANKTD